MSGMSELEHQGIDPPQEKPDVKTVRRHFRILKNKTVVVVVVVVVVVFFQKPGAPLAPPSGRTSFPSIPDRL